MLMPLVTGVLVALAMQTIQIGTGSPRQIDSRLSSDLVAQVEQLAGGRTWLLLGNHPRFSLEVYRLPQTTGPTVRRGQMVWLVAPPTEPPQWQVHQQLPWAQVALPGREFDDVNGSKDVNRPFRVAGVFRDSELIRLVEFIRSGAEVHAAQGTRAVNRMLPITLVERKPNGGDLVRVELHISESEHHIVTVKAVGEEWSIVEVLFVVA